MKLIVLASGSRGNGYILNSDNETLLIEAGVRLSKVKQSLNFNISHIAGCLISHSHFDHSKYIKEYMDAGIIIHANHEVFDKYRVPANYFRVKTIREDRRYKIGSFRILPVLVFHDVMCHSFLIEHPESGKILFMTDTFMTDSLFPGLNNIIIEINYADDILEDNIINGSVHPLMGPRLMETHMSLNTCKEVLQSNDLTNVVNIVLCHLSRGNADEERFVREIWEITGKQIFIAKNGLEIDFNLEPY